MPAHGLYDLRRYRCGCAAKLERAGVSLSVRADAIVNDKISRQIKRLRALPAEQRVALAKAKMERVLDHFLYVLELHANNSFIVYSPVLAAQIPRSYAANAFKVFQRGMHQIEIVRLCALWDSADPAKENIPTVIELIDDASVIKILHDEMRSHWADQPVGNAPTEPRLSRHQTAFGKRCRSVGVSVRWFASILRRHAAKPAGRAADHRRQAGRW